MAEPRQQFTFYRSYFDAIQELPKNAQSDIILAVCAYALYEIEPSGLSAMASAAFKLIRPTLDSGRRKAQSGKQGGSKPKANRKQTESNVENDYKNNYEYNYDADVEDDPFDASDLSADRKLKIINGDLGKGVIFLTEEQIKDLLDRLGVEFFDYYVERLANYIIDTGKKPTNHYATILKWWSEDSQIKD